MGERTKKHDIAELISGVRNKDDSAFSELLVKYGPLIEASVAKCLGTELYSLYADDFRQEATMVFYNSILAYDMEQYEVEFGLYAKICITNALISQLRQLRKKEAERLSGVAEEDLFAGEFEDPSAKLLEWESMRALLEVIRKHLSPFEYSIWQNYMSGMTAGQISQKLGKDKKSVENAICRVRKKLRALLENNT